MTTENVSGNFGDAIRWMRDDLRVARMPWLKWNPEMCIFLIRGRTVPYNTFISWKNNANKAFGPPEDIVIADHIDMKMAEGTYLTGWTPSQVDMLAHDWIALR